MKSVCILAIFFAFDLAFTTSEPPTRYHQARFTSANFKSNGNGNGKNNAYGPPSGSHGPSNGHPDTVAPAPYPPSGWKPEGPLLLVPGESQPGSESDLSPPPRPVYGPGQESSNSYIPQGVGFSGNGKDHSSDNGQDSQNGFGSNSHDNSLKNGITNGRNGNRLNGNGNGKHINNGNGHQNINGNGFSGNGHHNGNGNGNRNGQNNALNGNGLNGNENGHHHGNGIGLNGSGQQNGNGDNNGVNGNDNEGNANGSGHGNTFDKSYLNGGGTLFVSGGNNGGTTYFAATPTYLPSGSNDLGNGFPGILSTSYPSDPNYLASASNNLISAVPIRHPGQFFFILPGGRPQNLITSSIAGRKERDLLQSQISYQLFQPYQSALLPYRTTSYGLL